MKRSRLTPKFFSSPSIVYKDKNDCWLWKGYKQSSGYGQTRVDGKMKLAHRLSWEVHNDLITNGLCVLHHCDVRNCVNPKHLFLGTTQDNTKDCVVKQRAAYQKSDFNFTRKKRMRKLTETQVKEIRVSKKLLRHLAEQYAVSIATISNIKTGKRKNLIR